MGRPSPLEIEGTSISFRDPDAHGRMATATARAKDENGAWQSKRFKVESWRRDGSPIIPDDAKAWAKATRKTFLKEEAVAQVATFQAFAGLLAENLEASGVSKGRADFVRTVAEGLAAEGVSDMRRDTFPARVQSWIKGLDTCWSMSPDAKNRRRTLTPLAPATRNRILVVCKQVTKLAVRKRRLAFNPLDDIPRFKESETFKPLFGIDELQRMVSDEARDHAATERASLEAAILAHGGSRGEAIKSIAKERGCHWATIYNALSREPVPDPWWLACCLLVYTGCRAQEAMALRWEWFKWKEGVIRLKRADDYDSKTDQERMIRIEPELRAILNPITKTAGHILPPEIRAGGSGVSKREKSVNGGGSKDFTDAMRRYLRRIGMDPKDRTAHSLRHGYITLTLARKDTNVERLRKAVGHNSFETTMGYGKLSQYFEVEVDKWPDSTLWLRRPVHIESSGISGQG